MLLLKRKTFEASSDTPVVRAGEAATVAAAEEVIAAAEGEAAAIVAEAKSAYEAERKRGYADGIAEGREAILAQKLDMLEESVAFMERCEDRLADLVIRAMRKCVHEVGDRELVVQTVKKALEAVVRNQSLITVKVAPDMVETVRGRLQEILSDYPSVLHADVKEDRRFEGPACVVEMDVGSVETSIERQLSAIEQSIRKTMRTKN